MFKKLTLTVLAAGLVFGPRPAKATNIPNFGFIQAGQAGSGLEIASLDKEKPSKRERGEKEEKVTGREKESEGKKKYDDFKDRNGNGIDDRFERKETPKRKKKGEPGEVNF